MKKTILLVEDNKVQKLVSERMLAKVGYVVLWAADGEEGLCMARTHMPDLILLDMLLPKLGGVGVLHALKKDPATASIPVIALSAMSESNASKIEAEGAEDYFEKSKLYESKEGQSMFLAMIARVLGEHNEAVLPVLPLAERAHDTRR